MQCEANDNKIEEFPPLKIINFNSLKILKCVEVI